MSRHKAAWPELEDTARMNWAVARLLGASLAYAVACWLWAVYA